LVFTSYKKLQPIIWLYYKTTGYVRENKIQIYKSEVRVDECVSFFYQK